MNWMNWIKLTLWALLPNLMFASPAQACRIFRSPEQRIRDTYAGRADLRVALVQITEARHLSNPMVQKMQRLFPKYEAPWRVTASVVKILVSEGSPELIAFDRGWGSAACDDGTPMPRRGDRWVVYYTSAASIGTPQILESYPLKVALRADLRLRGNGG